MDNRERRLNEERQMQPATHQQINLNEYAGDAEDDLLAREQANEYLQDLDRRKSDSDKGVDKTANNQ